MGQKGISLIALIVTIIVIIILASIAIGGSFKTPTQATYARFCNDVDRVQEAIQVSFLSRKEKEIFKANKMSNEEIYTYIACGETASTDTKRINNELAVGIEQSDRIDITLPSYGTRKWYVGLTTGNAYLSPGFEYEGNLYVNATVMESEK